MTESDTIDRCISFGEAIALGSPKSHVNVKDLTAYLKDEVPREYELRKMREIFDTFDLQHEGCLTKTQVTLMLTRTGYPTSETELHKSIGQHFAERQTVTFEDFILWWDAQMAKLQNPDEKKNRFQLVSSRFVEPFEQHRLIVEETGDKETTDFRVRFYFQSVISGIKKPVSPWHDVPLYVKDVVLTVPVDQRLNKLNFVCEIPKWTRAKFEIATGEQYNPIKQDIKNGVLRYYKHGDMLFNYGCFPQTWEDPHHIWKETGVGDFGGDNDPIDCIEIGAQQIPTGGIKQVKVLGILGMIDAGEMDWKVISICHSDPMARFLFDITDVPKHLPGALECLREWLRVYKVCTGGETSQFAFNGEYRGVEFAMDVIKETHKSWKQLFCAQQHTTV